MRIDVHCHVGQRGRVPQPENRFSFEPAGEYAATDAYFSDALFDRITMKFALRHFGLRHDAPTPELDAGIERLLLEHILGARQVDRVVVLAFDQYHARDGQPMGGRSVVTPTGTDLYVSNTYVRELCRRYPEKLLFGASIHPYRRDGERDACDLLMEAAQAGAVLVKWLPLTQNIDAEDPRTVAFLRQAARLRMPLLIHYGGEMTLGNLHPEFMDPTPLLRTLRLLRDEGAMPTTIVAHVASPAIWPLESGRTFHTLVEALLGEFVYAPLYADISALAMANKAHWLRVVADMPELHPKLVYGSDFPIPPMPLAFPWRLRGRRNQIRKHASWIDQDVALKAALGIPESVFHRGGELLAHRVEYAEGLTANV